MQPCLLYTSYPVSANHDGTGEIIGAFCIEMDMQSAYGMVQQTNHISIICGLVAGAVSLLICLYTYYVYQKSKAEEQKQKQLLDVYKRQSRNHVDIIVPSVLLFASTRKRR